MGLVLVTLIDAPEPSIFIDGRGCAIHKRLQGSVLEISNAWLTKEVSTLYSSKSGIISGASLFILSVLPFFGSLKPIDQFTADAVRLVMLSVTNAKYLQSLVKLITLFKYSWAL